MKTHENSTGELKTLPIGNVSVTPIERELFRWLVSSMSNSKDAYLVDLSEFD